MTVGSNKPIILLSMLGLVLLTWSRPAIGAQQEQSLGPSTRVIHQPISVLTRSATIRVEPLYPDEAKFARVQGEVAVEITVDEKGAVISAQPISGHPMLREAAADAARLWKFTPTTVAGTPVKVISTITFNFTMDFDVSRAERVKKARDAVEAKPSSAKAHLRLGEAYLDNVQPAQAVDSLRLAIKLDPNAASAYILLGTALSFRGLGDEEIGVYRDALQVFPDSIQFLRRLAETLSGDERLDEAVGVWKQLIAVSPGDGGTYLQLGFDLFKGKHYNETVAVLRKATDLISGLGRNYAYNLLGAAYEELGQYQDAIDSYSHTLDLEPNNFSILYHIGLGYYEIGRTTEAETYLSKAVKVLTTPGFGGFTLVNPADAPRDAAARVPSRDLRNGAGGDPGDIAGVPGSVADLVAGAVADGVPGGVVGGVPGGLHGRSPGFALGGGSGGLPGGTVLPRGTPSGGLALMRMIGQDGLFIIPIIFEHLGDVYQANGQQELALDAWRKALKLASDPGDVSRIRGKLSGDASK
jgi:TonB family protein